MKKRKFFSFPGLARVGGFKKEKEKPVITRRISILEKAHQKMLYYTQASQGEISGLGKAEIRPNEIVITDVVLLKQKCGGADTHLDNEMLSRFLVDVINKGEVMTDYRLWWHSHNDFAVGWSAIDEHTIALHAKDTTLISICINKDGDMVARLDKGRYHEELVFHPPEDKDLRQVCRAEVKEKVTYQSYTRGGGFYDGKEDVVYATAGFSANGRSAKDDRKFSRGRFARQFYNPDFD